MATKKISELEAINAAEDNDVLVIVDTSESTTNKITKGNLLIGAGHTIEMTLNENYQIVLVLKNAAGTALSTQTIDLPNENAVTNLAYNNGILTVTKQSGATSQINLTGLIEGLVTENDFNTFKEALQTTLEAINEKDAEQDEAIAENYKVINKLNEKLENQQKVINQLPQVEGQGTSITLENTIEAQFTKFDVEGNSEQESTKGDNIISSENIDVTYMGVKYLSQNNGTILANGTKYGGAYLNLTNNIVNLENDTYSSKIFLLNGSISRDGTNVRPTVYLINQADTTKSYNIGEIGNPGKSQLIEAGTYYLRIATWQDNTIFANAEIGIMLVKGSTIPTDFEKFTYGASPNPNYEQPIYSAGDNENLFDKDNEEQFLQNLTPDNGGLIVSARTSTTSANYIRTIIIPCKSDANYVITRFLGGKTFFIYESDEYPTLNKQTTLLKRNNDAGKISEIIKTSATAKYLLVKIYNTFASEYYSYDELISSIKIEQGTKATPYSPYGMGRINEKIINKNVWDIDKFKNLYGTNSYETYNNVECLKLAGATQRYNFDGEENTQYTFQFKLIGSTLNSEIGAFSLVYSDGTSDYHDGILTPKTYAFTSKANKTLVRIVWNAWNAGNFIYIDKNSMQLEPGSTATPYVPHEEQDYSIFVQQPMRNIGDVRDCFVKKSDGWYERHYIGEVVLNGSENWGLAERSETSNGVFYIENFLNTYGIIREQCLSNYGTYVTGYSNKVGQFDIHYSQLRFYAYNNTATINDWKNKLTEKNLVINGFLAEPLDLPCTQAQIDVLENLPSTYKDFTIIQSEDETPAYLEVSGIYDLNKLITRTEVLESEV